MICYTLILHVFLAYATAHRTTPLVIAPPFLIQNGTSVVTVTHILPTGNADLSLRVMNGSKIISTVVEKIQKPGTSKAIPIQLFNAPDSVTIKIKVSGHEEVKLDMLVRADLYAVHIQTDKTIYKAGETVQVRALPLTSHGKIYAGNLEFILINSEGFEIVRKTKTAENAPVISESFELPYHLFYGDWKVQARPEGATDPQQTFAASFQVKEYDLPAFKLVASIDDDSDIENTGITIDARYFHGAPINGTFIIFCSNSSAHDSDHSAHIKAKSGELHNGIWSSTVNLMVCNKHENYTQKVIIEVRDHGTGSRNDIKLSWDPLSPKFNIIPMRPFFAPSIPNLPFIIEGEAESGEVWLSVACVAEKPPIGEVSSELQVKPQNVAQFALNKQWRNACPVIKLEAKQKLKQGFSKIKTMFIPNMRASVSGQNFVNIIEPKASYDVGDMVTLDLQTTDTLKLSYLILCNGQTILRGENNQNDRRLSFKVSERMQGTCLFFFYSTETSYASDMILFRVKDKCKSSISLSRMVNNETFPLSVPEDTIIPGDEIVIDFEGEPRGIAIYRAIDDRLNYMSLKNDIFMERLWDLSMFEERKTKGYQTKILNLVNVNEIKKTIESQCSAAGKALRSRCPIYSPASSIVSSMCLKYIDKECHRIAQKPTKPNDPFPPANFRTANLMPISFTSARVQEIRRPDNGVDTIAFNDIGIEKPHGLIRENFQEVWLFDSIVLGSDGTARVRSSSPDNIGQWAVTSVFWNKGRIAMCPTNVAYVQSKKTVFMNVEVPKEVYVNETVSVRVTVTATKLSKLTKFSICMPNLPRKVCADEGSFGNRGNPTYSNVALSPNEQVVTKSFTMRFLQTGETSLTFSLREEKFSPGKHFCDLGTVLDVVKMKLKIAQRADTVEYYKRILLNSEKPVMKLADDVTSSTDLLEQPIEVEEYRAGEEGNVVTKIVAHIPDTDTIYSFTVDISKFLPTPQFFNDVQKRLKRGIFDSSNSFLSDVISDLSSELYRFKTLSQKKNIGLVQLEWAQRRISDLISEMMKFSNCANEGEPCGFALFGPPENKERVSIFFTSIATSLLCEASVHERVILGSLKTISEAVSQLINNDLPNDMQNLLEFLDIKNPYDRKYVLASVMYQVSKDCVSYQEKIKEFQSSINEEFGRLYKIYYDFDETFLVDDRAVAAISYMASNATQELLRIKMLDKLDHDREPFWTAGVQSNTIEKVSSYNMISARRKRSGDTLVNSLGLLAFITAGAEGSQIDWDPLADWLFKQQKEDGSFENVLDTYFASRALYEYRRRKVLIDHNSDVQVKVTCEGCPTQIINATKNSVEIRLPNNVKKVELELSGVGKVKAEVRVVATRKQRLRRQLTQDDYYPVVISCEQDYFQGTTIQQTVCLRVLSPVVNKLEINHGIFTSYSTNPQLLTVAENSTEIVILNEAKSSYAMHFLLVNIPFNKTVCYKVGITEPPFSHEPIYLAPVAIEARHPFDGVVGLLTIVHPDVKPRTKRGIDLYTFFSSRTRRAIEDKTSVDTVCFSGGVCSCAETTCKVQCHQCEHDTEEALRGQLDHPDHFGAEVRVQSITKRVENQASYTVLLTDVYDTSGKGKINVSSKTLTIVIRDCNSKCLPSSEKFSKGDKFLLLGHADGLIFDTSGMQNYVLRSSDRFEEATKACKHLNTVITLKDD